MVEVYECRILFVAKDYKDSQLFLLVLYAAQDRRHETTTIERASTLSIVSIDVTNCNMLLPNQQEEMKTIGTNKSHIDSICVVHPAITKKMVYQKVSIYAGALSAHAH